MSEERSQNEQLMNYEEVKLNFFQNIILCIKVYFRIIPVKYQVVSLSTIIFLSSLDWTEKDKPIPLAIQILLTILVTAIVNLAIFGLGPLFIELLKDQMIPYVKDHFETEKEYLQKASLKKIDDILLKK